MRPLTGCCGCFNLRDGSQAIGITLVILGCLSLLLETGSTIHLYQEEDGHMTSGEIGRTVFEFFFSTLHICMDVMLVVAVKRSSRCMLLTWLIYTGIVTGMETIGVLVGFVIACIHGVWWLVLVVLGAMALVTVLWYWFAVVLNYYKDLREKNGFSYGKQDNIAL